MRVTESFVGDIRRKVFAEVARLAYEGGDYSRLEELPYRIIPGETAKYRESIFLERAIVGERLRLAIGLPLRPLGEHAPLTAGIEESAVAEKYYEPPLVNIIKFACNACPDKFVVSNCCQGCLAHPCTEICPKGAISIKGKRSVIDEEKCIKCGRCRDVCPYNAIIRLERPCAAACGVDAIGNDAHGLASIDYDKCVSCGMCIVRCPFGAISDKGQIFQVIHALKTGEEVIAIIAPSFVGQFGPKVTPEKLTSALKMLGFSGVAEVAIGADLCAIEEAKDFLRAVPAEQSFMSTSCCPSCAVLAKRQFPNLAVNISMALTPMVLTARMQKKEHPDCKIVFIGPCASKKLEASRHRIRSNVDFVLTFEELMGIFEAKGVDPATLEDAEPFREATAAGRGFPVPGGVAEAVAGVIHKLEPEREIKVVSADGLKECKKMFALAAAGKYDGYLLESMACPGGCMAGTGTLLPSKKTSPLVSKYQEEIEAKNALDSKHEITLGFLSGH